MRELSRRDAIEDRADDHEDRARTDPGRDRALAHLGWAVLANPRSPRLQESRIHRRRCELRPVATHSLDVDRRRALGHLDEPRAVLSCGVVDLDGRILPIILRRERHAIHPRHLRESRAMVEACLRRSRVDLAAFPIEHVEVEPTNRAAEADLAIPLREVTRGVELALVDANTDRGILVPPPPYPCSAVRACARMGEDASAQNCALAPRTNLAPRAYSQAAKSADCPVRRSFAACLRAWGSPVACPGPRALRGVAPAPPLRSKTGHASHGQRRSFDGTRA